MRRRQPQAEYVMTVDDWRALHTLWKTMQAVCLGTAPREMVRILAGTRPKTPVETPEGTA